MRKILFFSFPKVQNFREVIVREVVVPEVGARLFWLPFSFLLLSLVTTQAQHPGYKPLTNATAFREAFTTTARNTRSIKSEFIQEKNLSMLSEKLVSRGKFWFKKEAQVRMEYTQPFQYLMVINKSEVLIRDGQKENRLSTQSNKLFRQINNLVIDCVQGTVLDSPDFSVRVYENPAQFLVELTPVAKNMKSFFKTILIQVDKKDYTVLKIDLREPSGDNTLLTFVNKEVNVPLPDALFVAK